MRSDCWAAELPALGLPVPAPSTRLPTVCAPICGLVGFLGYTRVRLTALRPLSTGDGDPEPTWRVFGPILDCGR
jgi:hypothetical protein